MEKELFEKMMLNFSLGKKVEKGSKFSSKKLEDILGMVNQNFKKLMVPGEYLVVNSKNLQGQNLMKSELYNLKEFRVSDSS